MSHAHRLDPGLLNRTQRCKCYTARDCSISAESLEGASRTGPTELWQDGCRNVTSQNMPRPGMAHSRKHSCADYFHSVTTPAASGIHKVSQAKMSMATGTVRLVYLGIVCKWETYTCLSWRMEPKEGDVLILFKLLQTFDLRRGSECQEHIEHQGAPVPVQAQPMGECLRAFLHNTAAYLSKSAQPP